VPRNTPERPRGASAKRRSSLMPFYVILGLVLLAGVAFLATQLGGKDDGPGGTATEPIAVALTPEQLQRVPGISVGRADAPITIFEFADFQCPACGRWATFTEPLIKERLVNTGIARYVFYDFPLGGSHVHSFLAARAGRCANEQGKFWEYHAALFARQQEWSYERNAEEKLLEYGQQVGLNGDQFEQCVRSDKFAKEVSESKRLGETLGVGGTPTIYVNGQKLPEVPGSYSQFEQAVRQIAPAAFDQAPGAAPAGPAATAPAAPAAPADSDAAAAAPAGTR
jgi:protein-disulfide isomerase